MKKMSLQWRLTIITTLLIAMICGSLTIFIYKNGVYYIDSLQNTVDAKSEDNNEKNPDEIYISIPDEEWNNFAKNFSIQWYIIIKLTTKKAVCYFQHCYLFLEV